MPPNVGQLWAGGVGDLVLPQNGAGDLVLQEAVGGQGGEKVVDAGLLIPLPGGVVPGGPGAAQQGGDVQQLPGVQRAPHVGPLEGRGHRLDTGQRRRAPQDQHTQGRRGLGQSALHVVGVREWPQGPAALRALLCHRLVGQKPQHAGQFQSLNGFFKQIGHKPLILVKSSYILWNLKHIIIFHSVYCEVSILFPFCFPFTALGPLLYRSPFGPRWPSSSPR